MKRIRSQRSQVIEGSVAEVFKTMIDLDYLQGLEVGVQQTGPLKGRIGVGSRLIQPLKLHGRRIRAAFEVVDVEPNRVIVLENTSGPIPLRQRIEFEPAAQGRTRVTVETIGKPAIPSRIKRIKSEIRGASEYTLHALLPGDPTTPPPPPKLRRLSERKKTS